MDLQIGNSEQLLWSDVLHFSWTAENAKDHWDYSSATRAMIIMGWTVIELVTSRLSGCENVGYSFRKNLDNHISNNKLCPIDWSLDWGKVMSELISERKQIIHLSNSREIESFFYKEGISKKYLLRYRTVLNGLSKSFNSNESWWEDSQQEDYKLQRISGKYHFTAAGFKVETGHEVGYVFRGNRIVIAQVTADHSMEYFKKIKESISGPVSKIFIACNGEEIIAENFYSRGV